MTAVISSILLSSSSDSVALVSPAIAPPGLLETQNTHEYAGPLEPPT